MDAGSFVVKIKKGVVVIRGIISARFGGEFILGRIHMRTKKGGTMKRTICLSLLGFLVLAAGVPSAFAWGSATHAYMNSLMRSPNTTAGLDFIYGGMAPDVFNYMFDYPVYLGYLQDQTHHAFLKVWYQKQLAVERADALGFVSHNDTWAEDSSAHVRSRSLLKTEGYVITKAKALHEYLWANSPEYQGLSALGMTTDTYIAICHEMVEAAGDILMARIEPRVGGIIVKAALRPGTDLQNLLVRAYLDEFVVFAAGASLPISTEAAEALIRGAEQAFRQSMIAYGTLLQQDEGTIVTMMTENYNSMVSGYLAALGISLPPGTDMRPLIQAAISVSMSLCASDYKREIIATKNYVKAQLESRL